MAVDAIHQRRRWAVASVGAIAAWEDHLVWSLNLQGPEQHPVSSQAQHMLLSAKNPGLRDLSTATQANLPDEGKALRRKTCFCMYQRAKLPGGMGEHQCSWSSPSSAHTV